MFRIFFIVLLLLFLGVGFYHLYKPLPENISFSSVEYKLNSNSVFLLKDETYLNSNGARESNQEIFAEVFKMIDEAEYYILIDFFLFNNFMGTSKEEPYRALSSELTNRLITKKEKNPDIIIQLITDPINTVYGGYRAENLEKLESAGIKVINTDLTVLRDSNPLYSSVWRVLFKQLGNSDGKGYLPNPFDSEADKLGLRTYLAVLNYKANHRKVIMTDYSKADKARFSVLVTSANPHDGSSAHSNTALRVDSKLWQDLLITEAAVANFSQQEFIYPPSDLIEAVKEVERKEMEGDLIVQLLTEQKIKDKILTTIDSLNNGDSLDLAMFYLSDRDIVKALKEADRRGVKLRLLLDPNKDAFGREKNGIPNRQVADELISNTRGNTEIRWCDTHGEQCHSKLFIAKTTEATILIQGSANFTRRNLDDFNLETDIYLFGSSAEPVFVQVDSFFNRQWSNSNDRIYSIDYENYQDNSLLRKVTYRIKEFTGLSRW
ncbi:MAG: phospholipase D-like domain-containing protein [Candidatus Paceibacterota bacterium]